MSGTVSAALKFFQELKEDGWPALPENSTESQKEMERRESLKSSQHVSNLFQLLNDAFDVVNARCPKKSINLRNWDSRKKVFFLFC